MNNKLLLQKFAYSTHQVMNLKKKLVFIVFKNKIYE